MTLSVLYLKISRNILVDLERIKDLLKLGLSVRKIAKLFDYPNHLTLNTCINKRELREESSELA